MGSEQIAPGVFVVGSKPGCEDDAPNLGRAASACRGFRSQSSSTFNHDWFLSDPASNDLMNDNRQPQAADTRRIIWVFDQCRGGRC
jgi:hypothetical protein